MLSEKIRANGTYTHEFHPYPAKFPPIVVQELILRFSKFSDTVLDPFCGSGTTLVEARLEGRNAVGIELNPIGALISEAKSILYTDRERCFLKDFLNEFTIPTLEQREKTGKITQLDFPNKAHWFSEPIAKELGTLRFLIDEQADKNRKIGLLLKTAFSRIVVPVSNQDTETRYARIEKRLSRGAVYSLFIKTCTKYWTRLGNSTKKPNARNSTIIHKGDIAEQFPLIKDGSIDLILTSPPYINSFDYYLYHKQRMHWLGEDPKIIRRLEIGNHHRIDTKTFPEASKEYSDNMAFFLRHAYRVLRDRGYLAILIGDGIVKGKVLRAGELIERFSIRNGFRLVEKKTLDLIAVSKTFIKEKDRLSKKKHYTIIFQK